MKKRNNTLPGPEIEQWTSYPTVDDELTTIRLTNQSVKENAQQMTVELIGKCNE